MTQVCGLRTTCSCSRGFDVALLEVVHEEVRRERGDDRQPGVHVGRRARRWMPPSAALTRPKMPAPPTITGSSSWISETPRLPPAALRPSAAPFLADGVEEVDVGHRAGEVAAAEAGGRRDQAEHPVRRVRVLHRDREQQRRDQQQRGADHRPVAAAEPRHRERVRQPQQRADQVGQRDQEEQLLRGEREALREQERRADAPDQPDREAEVLGEDRPDQVAPGDLAAAVDSQNSGSSGRQSSIQRPVAARRVAVSGVGRVRSAS